MSKYGYYLGMTPEQQDIVKMIREFAERARSVKISSIMGASSTRS